jgi:hypothetical protein
MTLPVARGPARGHASPRGRALSLPGAYVFPGWISLLATPFSRLSRCFRGCRAAPSSAPATTELVGRESHPDPGRKRTDAWRVGAHRHVAVGAGRSTVRNLRRLLHTTRHARRFSAHYRQSHTRSAHTPVPVPVCCCPSSVVTAFQYANIGYRRKGPNLANTELSPSAPRRPPQASGPRTAPRTG